MFVHTALLRTVRLVPKGCSMLNLLRCRRGSAAFATVVALVPLIGAVALGGEAGSWYVTKQHAQNAADAAAISGVWRLICDQRGSCTDANSVDYRAKQFAAQNAFCNTGDNTSYPGGQCAAPLPGTSQSVTVDVGANQVRATVSQQQPTYLAKLLGLSTVNIGATAVAQVQILTNPCILSLTGSASFQGSATVNSPNCGVASNSTASNAFDFTGNGGLNINVPSFSAGGCSQTGGNQCDNVSQHAAPVPNPLSGLDSAIASLTTSSFSGPKKSGTSYDSYENCSCYNDGNKSLTGTLNGTYFFNGKVDIGTVTGTATLILFGGATLSKITGNPTIQLTAQKDHPQLPPGLSSVRSLMTDLLIYDPESFTNKGVDISGNSSSFFNGTIYVPKTPLTYSGNSSVDTPGCFQVIAYSVKFSGDTKLDNSKCKSDGATTFEVLIPRLTS
jgi:Flp pilus assembly protein TadG